MNQNRPKVSFKALQERILPEFAKARVHVCIAGQTGMGKTALIEGIKDQFDHFVTVQGASLENVDVNGMCDIQTIKPEIRDKNGNITQEKEVEVNFYRTSTFQFKEGESYLVYLDELNRAKLDVQQALLGLLNEHPVLGVHSIGNIDLFVVVTINDSTLQDDVNVSEVDGALKTRCANFILQPDIDDYINHLDKKYPNNIFVNFLRSTHRSEVIKKDMQNIFAEAAEVTPTPRNMNMLCKVLTANNVKVEDMNEYSNHIQGLVGSAVNSAFFAYINDLKRLDGKELLKKKPAKLFFDLLEEVSSENNETLISCLENAVSLLDKAEEKEILCFFENIKHFQKNYDELTAVAIQKIKTVERMSSYMARPEILEYFVVYSKKVVK